MNLTNDSARISADYEVSQVIVEAIFRSCPVSMVLVKADMQGELSADKILSIEETAATAVLTLVKELGVPEEKTRRIYEECLNRIEKG